MAGPNFVTGWNSASLAPKVNTVSALSNRTGGGREPYVSNPANPTDLSKKPASITPGVLSNPSATAVATNNANGQQTSLPFLRDAALGSRDPLQSLGLGKTGVSSSVYAHPDAPAFLADAVNNLNGSPGFAQQNLTNLLLQQILQGTQSQQDLHDTYSAHQQAQDKAMVAAAKAQAASNDHDTQLRLAALKGGMTLPTPVGTGAPSAFPIGNSGWAANSGWASPQTQFFQGAYTKALAGGDVGNYPVGAGSGWAPGTNNGMY